MMQTELREILNKHKKWLHGEDGGKCANLSDADLSNTDFIDANLNGANLDFSSGLPLWCGGLDVHIDDRQAVQMLYHVVRNTLYSKNTSDAVKTEVSKLVELANEFHRVDECGRIDGFKELKND